MATKTLVQLSDDIDGSTDNVSTVTFAYEGVQYEVDLNESNRKQLDEALSRFIGAGRKVGGGSRTRRNAATPKQVDTAPDPKAVRAWAEANGITVSPRGRIPSETIEKFLAANR